MANQGRKKTPPSQPPSPSGEEASSTASSAGSESDPLVGDPGPTFEPGEGPGPEEAPPRQAAEILDALPEWEEEVIANLLGLKGRVLHAVAGVAEEDWVYTEIDLAAIVPPLVRILNRYEPTRRYAGHADPIMIAFGVGGYGLRSLIERSQALAAEEEYQTEEPIPPAAPDAGPVPSTPPSTPPAAPAGAAATPPAPPPPPPPRAAAHLPATAGRRTAGAPVAAGPPPEGAAPINAEEVPWERGS